MANRRKPTQDDRLPDGVERRTLPAAGLVVRDADGAVSTIEGYAAVFNQPAYGEVIRPGAFTKTLRERPDIRALWSHNSDLVLARTANGTLELAEDDHGLRVRLRPPQSITWCKDALEAVRTGLVTGFSFGMRIIDARQEEHDGQPVTALREVALYEVSPVAEPWYEGTEAVARDRLGHPPATGHGPLVSLLHTLNEQLLLQETL